MINLENKEFLDFFFFLILFLPCSPSQSIKGKKNRKKSACKGKEKYIKIFFFLYFSLFPPVFNEKNPPHGKLQIEDFFFSSLLLVKLTYLSI